MKLKELLETISADNYIIRVWAGSLNVIKSSLVEYPVDVFQLCEQYLNYDVESYVVYVKYKFADRMYDIYLSR